MLSVGLKYIKQNSMILYSGVNVLFQLPDVDFAGENAGDVDVFQVKDGSIQTGLVELDGGVSVHQVSSTLTARLFTLLCYTSRESSYLRDSLDIFYQRTCRKERTTCCKGP